MSSISEIKALMIDLDRQDIDDLEEQAYIRPLSTEDKLMFIEHRRHRLWTILFKLLEHLEKKE